MTTNYVEAYIIVGKKMSVEEFDAFCVENQIDLADDDEAIEMQIEDRFGYSVFRVDDMIYLGKIVHNNQTNDTIDLHVMRETLRKMSNDDHNVKLYSVVIDNNYL